MKIYNSEQLPKFNIFTIIFCFGAFFSTTWAVDATPKDFLEVPRDSRPIDGLLPKRGMNYEKKGMLKINSKYLNSYHRINFDTREVDIIHYIKIEGQGDSTVIYAAYYREIGEYSLEMNRLARYKFWLDQYIGQGDVNAGGGDTDFMEWVLPVKVPEWMKRWGADKPKLNINGSYKVIVSGKSIRDSKGTKDNWIPTFNMENKPSFSVTGSIGRLIHIEIFNEEGFGTNFKDQLKIAYRGEGDELEDNIIQEIEAGNTSLALTGTALTGYTENHKGMFGLKMRMKFGNLNITTIASQEGGSQERQTLGAGEEETTFDVDDNRMSLYKHFFLELKDREDYADSAVNKGMGSQSYLTGKIGVVPEVFIPTRSTKTDVNKAFPAIAYAFDAEGNKTPLTEKTSWEQLVPQEDFTYNTQLRMLTVHSGRQSQAIAVRWNQDLLDKMNISKAETDAEGNRSLILIKSRRADHNNVLEPLMWRHVYSIGKVSPENRSKFKLTVMRKHDKVQHINNQNFTTMLGLTQPGKPNELAVDNPHIFDFDNGLLILPCEVIDTVPPLTGSREHCLTPFKRVNPEVTFYEDPPDDINRSSAYKFEIKGKQRQSTFDVSKTSHSVSGGGCFDITPDTEELVLNGSIVLERGVDYEVLYEVGQITLLSLRAKDPTAKIEISYECTPFVQIQDKILLGTRWEYNLDAISDESLLGATLLYKSQSTTQQRPQLGREPFRELLWGFNSRLSGSPEWMTNFVNLIPLINTTADSKVNWEFEIAQSRYNPNPKGSALLDDFEGSKREFLLPLTIYSWSEASPPGQVAGDVNYNEKLNYQHQGEFIWHSNISERFERVFGPTINSRTNSRELRLMKFIMRPNDNLQGNSWGGVMRGLTTGLRNQSRKRVLEIVVRGREGKFFVDMGRISEDLSVAGEQPSGELDAEVLPGEFSNNNDFGLDGLASGEGETGKKWECKPSCFAVPPKERDPADDDWVEPLEGETDPVSGVNGTEGNNKGGGGISFDTEDITGNGALDTKNSFARYEVDLNDACNTATHCEPLANDWRKYQLSLYEPENFEIISDENPDIEQILSEVEITRMWMGNLPVGVSQSEILLARVSLTGNTWEEESRNKKYENRETFNDGETIYEIEPDVLDSNVLRVSVINNREEDLYVSSPNTKIEEDPETDEPLREQSLVLNYENLHPGEVVHATRILSSDEKDLTLYSKLLMEVHPKFDTTTGTISQASFAIQLGIDAGSEESRDYYEIKIHLDEDAEKYDTIRTTTRYNTRDNPEELRRKELEQTLWLNHVMQVNLKDLSDLKNTDAWRKDRINSEYVYNSARKDNSMKITVVGDPSLSKINWMRLVVAIDSTASPNQSGEIWVNDLRLSGINKNAGTSMRTGFQADFADFFNIGGNITVTDGNFVSLTQVDGGQKKTPANSQTSVDFNSSASLFANKFLPDKWAVSLPLTVQYQGSIFRPFTKPNSDELLVNHDIGDFLDDFMAEELSTVNEEEDRAENKSRFYQTRTSKEIYKTSYRKEKRSKNFAVQTFFERPTFEYTQTLSKSASPLQDDTTQSYKSKVTYDLSPYKPLSWEPLKFTKKIDYVPKFIQDFEISPFPNRVQLVVADYSFVNSRVIKKTVNGTQPDLLEQDWEVDMSHGLDLTWKPLNFFNLNYRISVNREFDEIHDVFSGEEFFDVNSENGPLAWEILTAKDSSAARGLDVYGVIANERNRNQSFQMDFNPQIITWIPTSAKLSSQYQHTRSAEVELNAPRLGYAGAFTPEHFNAESNHDISFNTGFKINTFFTSMQKITKPIKWLSESFAAAKKKTNKLKLRNIDASYTISHRYTGEEFTFEEMNRRNISPFDFYAYQLGLIYDPKVLYSYDTFREQVILGQGAENAHFFDYLSVPMINPTPMSHSITRSADIRSGFTIPVLDLNLSGTLKWSTSYSFPRDYLLWKAHDTSIVWPDYSITGRFSNFANKIPFLKKRFRSFSANTSYNFKKETKFNHFATNQDSREVSHNWNPLLKLTASSKSNIRYENAVNHSFSRKFELNKTDYQNVAMVPTYAGPRILPIYEHRDTLDNQTKIENIKISDIFTISYDIKTQKGIQFWKWFIKLENNLKLKWTNELAWTRNTRFLRTFNSEGVREPNDPERDMDEILFKTRPELSYNFTRKIDGKFFTQYIRKQEFQTADNDVRHEIEVHSEFTMRF